MASSLQNYVHWLVCDELVSVGRSLVPPTPALLQAVATHVQASHNSMKTCYYQQVPLKFVFGHSHCMTFFTHHLETLPVSGYSLVKVEDYYYLRSEPRPSSSTQLGDTTSDILGSELNLFPGCQQTSETDLAKTPPPALLTSETALARSKTPPPPLPTTPRRHKRSLSSGYPFGHSPKPIPIQLHSNLGSSEDLLLKIASGCVSDNVSMMSSVAVKESSRGSRLESKAWMVLRVLSGKVELYSQLSHSGQTESSDLSELRGVCEELLAVVRDSCRRTNQWFLMKEMLDTHKCSPLLLSESASEAWVEKVVVQQQQQSRGAEPFRAEQFMCDLVYSTNITPNWRVREMKGT